MNFIPARFTGLLLVAAAYVWTCDGRVAWRIMRRDGRRHPSPNSGVPEAAMAGALGVQLGGMNYYHGVLCERPLLGDALFTRARRHIRIAVKLAWTASLLLLVMILAGKAL
jgi:adenosylcobinamide-phosphate synthase